MWTAENTYQTMEQILYVCEATAQCELESGLRSSGGGVRTPCTLPLDPPLA